MVPRAKSHVQVVVFDTRTYFFGNYVKLPQMRSRQINGIISSENYIVVRLY